MGDGIMWCNNCKHETIQEICELCGNKTDEDIPIEIYWCNECKIPIIKSVNDVDIDTCSICGSQTKYMSSDLRIVFPEERLLLEILLDKPLAFFKSSVWANNNRYYVDGKTITITSSYYKKYNPDYLIKQLNQYKVQNDYKYFNIYVQKFIEANRLRLNYLINEAHSFI